VMRRLNLSYGPSVMIGGYLGTVVYLQFGAGPLVVAAAVVIGAALAGLYVERLCFAPMKAGAAIASMVSSFAIWMQLEQAAILVLPRHTYAFPALATGAPLELGPFAIRSDHLVMLASALGLAAVVQLVLYRTRFGLALRAIIGNPVAAHLVGVDVRTVMPLAFAGASAIGGVAGFLVLAVDQQITPMFGMWATLKGLIAMMIGGLGSVPGAVLGGCFSASSRRKANGISGRRSATSWPISCCLRSWPSARAGWSAACPKPRRRRRERWTTT